MVNWRSNVTVGKKSSARCQETRGWIFQSSDFRRENDSLEIGKLNLNSSTDPFQRLPTLTRFFFSPLSHFSGFFFTRNSSRHYFTYWRWNPSVNWSLSTIFMHQQQINRQYLFYFTIYTYFQFNIIETIKIQQSRVLSMLIGLYLVCWIIIQAARWELIVLGPTVWGWLAWLDFASRYCCISYNFPWVIIRHTYSYSSLP